MHSRDAPKGKAPWALAPKRREALTSAPKTFFLGHSPLQRHVSVVLHLDHPLDSSSTQIVTVLSIR